MTNKKPAQYPDTKQGAIDCLTNESTYDMTQVKGVKPDPYAKGVWAVDMYSGTRVIVYLMGYGENKDKTYNDFEEGEA